MPPPLLFAIERPRTWFFPARCLQRLFFSPICFHTTAFKSFFLSLSLSLIVIIIVLFHFAFELPGTALPIQVATHTHASCRRTISLCAFRALFAAKKKKNSFSSFHLRRYQNGEAAQGSSKATEGKCKGEDRRCTQVRHRLTSASPAPTRRGRPRYPAVHRGSCPSLHGQRRRVGGGGEGKRCDGGRAVVIRCEAAPRCSGSRISRGTRDEEVEKSHVSEYAERGQRHVHTTAVDKLVCNRQQREEAEETEEADDAVGDERCRCGCRRVGRK